MQLHFNIVLRPWSSLGPRWLLLGSPAPYCSNQPDCREDDAAAHRTSCRAGEAGVADGGFGAARISNGECEAAWAEERPLQTYVCWCNSLSNHDWPSGTTGPTVLSPTPSTPPSPQPSELPSPVELSTSTRTAASGLWKIHHSSGVCNSSFRFVERNGEADYLDIIPGDGGCYAIIPYRPGGGRHEVGLEQNGCVTLKITVHELVTLIIALLHSYTSSHFIALVTPDMQKVWKIAQAHFSTPKISIKNA